MDGLWIWEFLDEQLGSYPTLAEARGSMDTVFRDDVEREWDEIEEGGVKKGALWIRFPGEHWQLSHHRLYRNDNAVPLDLREALGRLAEKVAA